MNFNGLIPELSVTNLEQSKFFYLTILHFKLEYERPQDKFAFLSYGAAQLMLEEVNGYWEVAPLDFPLGRGINFQIQTTEIYELIYRLHQYNIPLFRGLFESEYECNGELLLEKEFLVQDPDGYLLRFSQTVTLA